MEADLETLMRRAADADGAAADTLFALWYHELHRLAEAQLRRGGGGGGGALTLGTTTLVHEAYLNIVGRRDAVAFADRARFLGYASRAMRGLVIDYARRRGAKKRGRQFEVTLADDEHQLSAAVGPAAQELSRLGDALDELAALEPSLAELVDLHFFCGFSFGEIAALRQLSERTVQRDWRKARLLLQHALLADGGDDDDAPAGG